MYLRFVFHLLIISAIIFLRWHLLTGIRRGTHHHCQQRSRNPSMGLIYSWLPILFLHQIFLKPRLDPFGQLELTWTFFSFFFLVWRLVSSVFLFLSLSFSLILWKYILNVPGWRSLNEVWTMVVVYGIKVTLRREAQGNSSGKKEQRIFGKKLRTFDQMDEEKFVVICAFFHSWWSFFFGEKNGWKVIYIYIYSLIQRYC